eukprot:1871988-Ditylum_brightwellii.AAC.2
MSKAVRSISAFVINCLVGTGTGPGMIGGGNVVPVIVWCTADTFIIRLSHNLRKNWMWEICLYIVHRTIGGHIALEQQQQCCCQ